MLSSTVTRTIVTTLAAAVGAVTLGLSGPRMRGPKARCPAEPAA
ncbi:hypothetical protein [Actinomadura rubrisoli]|nr:hypothetical protein [Actinomadura rubrisoli]